MFIHLLNLHKKATLFPYSLPGWTRIREKLRTCGENIIMYEKVMKAQMGLLEYRIMGNEAKSHQW